MDHLATLFDEVVHIGCLHPESPPSSSLAYEACNLRLQLVPAAGGRGLRAKLDVLRRIPGWAMAVVRALRQADAVHVRCPANVSLIALFVLFASKKPEARWIKYAGNWRPAAHDPLTYRLQRWLLRRADHGAVVTVNGKWSNECDHVIPFVNPCLSELEIQRGRVVARTKTLQEPVGLCFVGRIEQEKGAEKALSILRRLHAEGLTSTLTFVGGGVLLRHLIDRARNWGLESSVQFSGWLPRDELPRVLSKSHFVILPTSASEGFPKALAEGMAYGAVPIGGAVSSIPQLLQETGAGIAIDPQDEQGFVDAIFRFVRHEDLWTEAVEKGLAAAGLFTYDAYLKNVIELFEANLGISLRKEASRTAKDS